MPKSRHSYRTARNADMTARAWGKSLDKKDWYSIKSEGEVAEIRIYDVIGWPFIDADSFLSELDTVKSAKIRARINSPGGDVFDGTAIFNALKDHPAEINVEIEGLAASMASIIALAGDNIQIADNAWYMIHNPWTFMVGDFNDLRKEADLLERMSLVMADTYQSKTGGKVEDIKQWMTEETWFNGKEAVDAGFADSVLGESAKAVAQFNASIFENTPDEINALFDHMKPGKREAEKSLRDAGFSRTEAKAIVSCGFENQRDADRDWLQNISQAFDSILN